MKKDIYYNITENCMKIPNMGNLKHLKSILSMEKLNIFLLKEKLK